MKEQKIIELVNKAFATEAMREAAIEVISCGGGVAEVTEEVASHAEASSALSGHEEYLCIKGSVEGILEELGMIEAKEPTPEKPRKKLEIKPEWIWVDDSWQWELMKDFTILVTDNNENRLFTCICEKVRPTHELYWLYWIIENYWEIATFSSVDHAKSEIEEIVNCFLNPPAALLEKAQEVE